MGKEFLNNLKKAVDTGEFNSEIANKLNEINKKADDFKDLSEDDLAEKIKKRIGEENVKKINEEDFETLKSDYEKEINSLKKEDEAYKCISQLWELDSRILESVNELLTLCKKYETAYEEENEVFDKLRSTIKQYKNKYNMFNN